MLPEDEQEDCFSDWSDALDIRVVDDVLPSATFANALPTNDASSSSTQSTASLMETTEPTSSCMYIQSDSTVYFHSCFSLIGNLRLLSHTFACFITMRSKV